MAGNHKQQHHLKRDRSNVMNQQHGRLWEALLSFSLWSSEFILTPQYFILFAIWIEAITTHEAGLQARGFSGVMRRLLFAQCGVFFSSVTAILQSEDCFTAATSCFRLILADLKQPSQTFIRSSDKKHVQPFSLLPYRIRVIPSGLR